MYYILFYSEEKGQMDRIDWDIVLFSIAVYSIIAVILIGGIFIYYDDKKHNDFCHNTYGELYTSKLIGSIGKEGIYNCCKTPVIEKDEKFNIEEVCKKGLK